MIWSTGSEDQIGWVLRFTGLMGDLVYRFGGPDWVGAEVYRFDG